MLVGHARSLKEPRKKVLRTVAFHGGFFQALQDLPFLQLVVPILYKVPLLLILAQIMGFPARAATSSNELPYFFSIFFFSP